MEKKRLKLLVCALAIAWAAGLANADIETGLVGYWPFDDGPGATTALDSTGNSDGTLWGDPQWVAGSVGDWALEFDAVDDHVIVEHVAVHDDFDIELTVAGWMKPDWEDTDLTNSAGIFAKRIGTGGGWGCRIIRDGLGNTFAGRVYGVNGVSPSLSCSVDVNDGSWHHFALVTDGTNMKMYIDGVFDTELNYDHGVIKSGVGEIRIAKSIYSRPELGTDDIYMYRGLMDDIRFYNRALSGDDVIELVAMSDPDYNFPPSVDAGDYQSVLWQEPSVTVQLDATAGDDGKPADPCQVTLTWSKVSGPGSVAFDPCNSVEDPCATFDAAGFYELRLRGYDGEKDSCDVVTIYVRPDDNPIAYWNFDEGSGPVDDDSAN
ncbi:MAG: LamG domain-containing protein, partial [Sedimentisphaerales bacterium]|nr:LamG domain-containing protein [Sedimentisphaerales bacterium]